MLSVSAALPGIEPNVFSGCSTFISHRICSVDICIGAPCGAIWIPSEVCSVSSRCGTGKLLKSRRLRDVGAACSDLLRRTWPSLASRKEGFGPIWDPDDPVEALLQRDF